MISPPHVARIPGLIGVLLCFLVTSAATQDAHHARPRMAAGGAAWAGSVPVDISGVLQPYRRVTLALQGPATSELAPSNPFLEVAMAVTFVHVSSGLTHRVPGYFAADGQAGETGASAGNIWKAHLSPGLSGTWTWSVSFRWGDLVALKPFGSGTALAPYHGLSGDFEVQPIGAAPSSSLRANGRLRMGSAHHLLHEGNDEAWLQTGTNSPENFLAYTGFDQSPLAQHEYLPHLADWAPGDPTWHNGVEGKGIIGALNYLQSVGVNAMSMLVYNVGGDGHDVWPFTSIFKRLRYDVSKLDQWERVFEHMDDRGISLQMFLQEQENDTGPNALDGGDLGIERRLFHRELIARFGHHLGLIINLGEENQNSVTQQVAFYENLRELDAYGHPILVHTFPTDIANIYQPLLAAGVLEGASLQSAQLSEVHLASLIIRKWSDNAGVPWVVNLDEIGPPEHGVLPDAIDPSHDGPRIQALWGNLMAGGGGAQWYFGYSWDHHDLDLEDFRSRDKMYRISSYAREFMTRMPFAQMQPDDELVLAGQAWALHKPEAAYAVYLPAGGEITLDLPDEPQSTWRVRWFNPRTGGEPVAPSQLFHVPGQTHDLSAPTAGPNNDWAVSLELLGVAPTVVSAAISPTLFSGGDLRVDASILDPDNDLNSVVGHMFDPHGSWVGVLPFTPQGNAHWALQMHTMNNLSPGTWTCMIVVNDDLGHVAWATPTVKAL